MEFGAAEFVAIGVVLLNVIVYFFHVSPRKDLNDLPIELRSEIRDVRNELRNEMTELRNEMNVRFSKLDEAFTNHLMFMHGTSHQPPTQGETEQ